MDDGLDEARMLGAPRARGVFPDARTEGFTIPKQRTNDNRVRREEIISHPPVVAQEDIPDEVANWFHAIEDEYHEQVKDLLRMRENADRERDALSDELVDLRRQLDDSVLALTVKWAECDRMAQHASDNIKDDAVPLLFDDATAKEMVKLKREISTNNVLNKSMQAKLGAALQEVEKTKKALATAEDERDMICEQMDSATMEVNSTNKALIRVKVNSAPISTFQSNSSNRIFNVKTAGLSTYDGTRTLNTTTSFLSTLHRHLGPRTQELGLTDECGIPLTNSWAVAALLQVRDMAAVWANHQFPAHASAGVAWEDFSAAVKEAFIPPDAVTRLKRNGESLYIKGGKHVSGFNECFRVLRHQLDPHAPLCDERLRD
jgi:hypothetical protein